MSTRVVLKLPDGRECGPFSINSTSEADVFGELPKLFRVITQQHIHVRVPGTQFFVEVPNCAGYIYIALPPTSGVENSSHETIEVYAVKVEQGGQLSEGEIRNHLYNNFGKQLEYAMSVISSPKEDKTEERYTGYPCGTLLRVTNDGHPHHPSVAPHPAVATSTISASTQAMVAGTNDRKISQLSDSQLPDSSRKNLAPVTCLHQEKMTLSKWAIQSRVECNGDVNPASSAGHHSDSTPVSLSGTELAHITPTRDNPKIVVTETDDGPVKLVVEAEEESSSKSAPSQEEQRQNQLKKSATVSLVTGMHVRTSSDVSTYEQLGEPQTNHMRARTLSDSNIAARQKECMVIGNSKDIQESVTRRNSEPTPAPTSSLPHEPHQPIQRQSSGDNETVMGGARPTFGVSNEKQNEPTQSNDLDGDKVVDNGASMKSKEDEEYLSTRAKVSFVVGEEEENDSRDDESFLSHPTTFSSHDQSELYEQSDDYITESEDPLVVEENSEMMQQVHLLEHACNGKCFKGSLCNIHLTDQQFTLEVEQMQAAVRRLNDGTAHPDVKEYIRIHCDRCDMAGCKVPHMAAGCPPPPPKRVPSQPTPPESSKGWSVQTPGCHARRLPVGSISFDETAAFLSPSPSNDEHSDVRPTSNHSPIPTPKPNRLDFLKEYNPPVAPSSPPLYVHRPHHPPSPPPTPHTPHNQYTLQQPLTPSVLPNRRLDQPITPRGVHHPTLATNQDYADYQQQLKSSAFHGHNATYQATSMYHQRQLGGAYSFLGQNTATTTSTVTPARRLPDISMSGFPKNLNCYPWFSAGTSNAMLIYSSQELQDMGLMPGCDVPRPNMVKRDELGSGGNGTVFKQFIGGQEYAIKRTRYRPAELNIWHKLDHPNVIPLLGVMLDNDRSHCLQMMPKMTTDFREVIRGLHQRYGSVQHLVQMETQTWRELVQPNACYIFQEMLQGLNYLYHNNIQHGDLKATNVLIKKKCACPDVLHCCCPRRDKCEVRIADFDALRKTTQYSAKAANLPEVTTSAKTPEGMNTVLGTMGYRALEQFQKIDDDPATNPLVLTHKRIIEGSATEVYDLSGPWCDIWSLGVILLQFCLGSPSQEDKTESWHLHHKPQEKQLSPQVEATCVILRLNKLLSMCANCHELIAFSHLAAKCLVIQFRKRPTPEDLLNDDMFNR